MYVSAIALYDQVHVASSYFATHRELVDKLTGVDVAIFLVGAECDRGTVVIRDDQSGSGKRRLKGVGFSDLPCLYVEAQIGEFIIRLPGEAEGIHKAIGAVVDAAQSSSSFDGLRARVKEIMAEPQENVPLVRLWSIGTLFVFVLAAVTGVVAVVLRAGLMWYQLIVALLVLEGLFVTVGVFILRAAGLVTEEGFLGTITKVFKFQLTGFKLGLGKSDDPPSPPKGNG